MIHTKNCQIQDESKIEGPELKKQKSETESDESFVEVPSAKKIVEEMNQEESEDELEDNVIDDDEIEFQGTNEPEIINDIPVNHFKNTIQPSECDMIYFSK